MGSKLVFLPTLSVADTVGKEIDSVGKAFDSVNNIADSVGNR